MSRVRLILALRRVRAAGDRGRLHMYGRPRALGRKNHRKTQVGSDQQLRLSSPHRSDRLQLYTRLQRPCGWNAAPASAIDHPLRAHQRPRARGKIPASLFRQLDQGPHAASALRRLSCTCLSLAVRRSRQGDAPVGPLRGDSNLLSKPDPLPGATPPLARAETAHSPDGPSFTADSTRATHSLRVYVRGARFRSTPVYPSAQGSRGSGSR